MFFTQSETNSKIKHGFNFTEEFFDQNEAIFVAILFQKHVTSDYFKNSACIDLARGAMDSVFKTMPNQRNIKMLFENPAI